MGLRMTRIWNDVREESVAVRMENVQNNSQLCRRRSNQSIEQAGLE